MSHEDKRGRGRRGRGERATHRPQHSNESGAAVDENSVVVQQFLGYQKALDTRHDKHERLVKLSRDVTIDSKRTIFTLQRISSDEDKAKILPEAAQKLSEIQKTRWCPLAAELGGEDPYQFLRAYSPGLQEYIEAISFHRFLECGELISLEEVQATLSFPHSEAENQTEKQTDSSSAPTQAVGEQTETEPVLPTAPDTSQVLDTPPDPRPPLYVHVPPMEYMLGVADLTGEVMRMAIHSVGSGQFSLPRQYCRFLQEVHDHFLLFGNTSRELSRKMFTLKQSLQKVEAACYTLQVRGSEIPKHRLVDVLDTAGGSGAEDLSGTL